MDLLVFLTRGKIAVSDFLLVTADVCSEMSRLCWNFGT